MAELKKWRLACTPNKLAPIRREDVLFYGANWAKVQNHKQWFGRFSAFSIYAASRLKMASRIPPASPAAIMLTQVEGGATLAEALKRFPKQFDEPNQHENQRRCIHPGCRDHCGGRVGDR